MSRNFEIISEKQFEKDFKLYNLKYEELKIPERLTNKAAGYDFYCTINFTLKPSEIIKIPTGVKVYMNEDEMLMIVIRSSTGFKYNVRMTNQVGIIDSDYYNNTYNEGHIFVSIQNHSDKDFLINKGDRIAQGIFQKYLLADYEENKKNNRVGGLGSTNGYEE